MHGSPLSEEIVAPSPTPTELEDLKVMFATYSQLGMNRDAHKLALTILKFEPNTPQNHRNVGVTSTQIEEHELAVIHLEEAAHHMDNDLQVFKCLGESYFKLGQWEKAIISYSKAQQIDPEDTSMFKNMINAYSHLEEPAALLTTYYTASEANQLSDAKDVEILWKVVESHQKLQEDKEALLIVTEILLLQPTNLQAIVFLSKAFFNSEDYHKALEAARLGILAHPEEAECYLLSAQSYDKVGQYEEALEATNQYLISHPQCSEAYRLQGSILLQLNQVEEAEISYNNAIKYAESRDVTLLEFVAAQYSKFGHYGKALDVIREGLQIEPDNLELRVVLSTILTFEGNIQAAALIAEEVIQIDHTIPQLWHYKALAHIALGEYNLAKDCLIEAIGLDRSQISYYAQLKLCAQMSGDIALATQAHTAIFQLFGSYIEDSPEFITANCTTEAYFDTGQRQYKEPSIFERRKAYANLNQVRERIKDNELSQAQILWNQVIKVIPASREAMVEGMKLFISLKEYTKAEELSWKANRLLNDNSDALKEQIVRLYSETGKYQEAAQIYDIISNDPDILDWNATLGKVHLHIGEGRNCYQRAISSYEVVIQQVPQESTFYYNLKELVKKLMELNIGMPSEQAETLLSKFQHYMEKYQKLSQVCHSNTATAYNALGEYDKAIHAAQEALIFDPERVNMVTLVNLATAYRAKGYQEEDYKSLETAYNLYNELTQKGNDIHLTHDFTEARCNILFKMNELLRDSAWEQNIESLSRDDSSGYASESPELAAKQLDILSSSIEAQSPSILGDDADKADSTLENIF